MPDRIPEHGLVRIGSNSRPSITALRTSHKKTHAGFAIYAHAQDAPNLRRVLEQREVTAEILIIIYEYSSPSRRTAHGVWLYRDGGSIPLCRSHPFGILHSEAVPDLRWRAPRKTIISIFPEILNKDHASVRDYMGDGSIYHLFSRTLYRQIEKGNLRNRRAHSFEFIRTRLVLLDFILAHREAEYLETEPDKINFFCEKLNVAKEFLPGKVYEGPGSRPTIRYFVDKFPLFLAPLLPGTPPVVTSSYVDSGFGTISAFLTHLAAYQSLFRQLHSFRFLYISPRETEFPRVEECFHHAVKKPLEPDVSGEIIRYFQVRRRFESRQYIVPVTEDFEFLNEVEHGERFENLYRDLSGAPAPVAPRGYRARTGERGVKDTDHPPVHRSVHRFVERKR